MRIAIFGGTGFFGSSIKNFFEKKNFKCFITSKHQKSHFKSDLQSEEKIFKFLKKIKPSIVINCSAETNVELCNKDFLKAFKSNALSIRNIVSAVKKLKKNIILIHISTDQVYNSIKSNTERQVNLTNNYSISKYLGELEAQNYENSLIIRTNFFGKSNSRYRLSFSDYIIYNVNKKSKIFIPKNIYFNPIHINFLIEIIFKLLSKKIKGTFNVGSKNSISKYQFAKKIILKKKLNSKYLKGFTSNYLIHKRPLSTYMSTKKIKRKIKMNLPSIESGIDLL